MTSKSHSDPAAQIDFHCLNPDCRAVVRFGLSDIADKKFQALCRNCHSSYEFDDTLRDKLKRMLELVRAIRNAEDILGDSNVAVTTAHEEVRIPYTLLMTRLNTIITLEFGDQQVDFHLWIEPASPDTFR